jgi:hypothetical protein
VRAWVPLGFIRIEKGKRRYGLDFVASFIVAGFIPNPFDQVRQYFPSIPEIMIALGVWAKGFLLLTILFRIAASVKEEVA